MCSLKNVFLIGFALFARSNVVACVVYIGFTMSSLENDQKQMMLFYCVFDQKVFKSIGFTVCSLKSIEKALVLLCFRSKKLKNQRLYCKIIVKMQKKHGFTMKNLKKEQKPL